MKAMKTAYSVGIDFGTLSARAVLWDTQTGEVKANAVCEYENGVITEMPKGKPLPDGYALQHPRDYLNALRSVVSTLLKEAKVPPSAIVGLGIDFTASTLLPVDEKGDPLCFLPAFENEPHAYVKLWKHHGATKEAEDINRIAKERGESFLARYGGSVSSEFFLPKVLETLRQAPAVYDAAACFSEAGDWLTRVLVGAPVHTAVFAGYKALWEEKEGFPSCAFLSALEPRLSSLYEEKVILPVKGLNEKAGYLSEEGSRYTGLPKGIAVALPMIDAHASLPAFHILEEGEAMLILGTSACHILNSREKRAIDGICGYVDGAVVPELYTYEAGQSCFGEHFSWFAENALPSAYYEEAKRRGQPIFAYLNELASLLEVGESGLLALDWFSGNRSPLNNDDLCGLIVGFRPDTKPEEVYRALLEAVAFGTKRIFENFKKQGLPVSRIVVGGGIAEKNPLLMQILADVLNMPILVPSIPYSSAVGAAMYAAVASGELQDLATAADRIKPQKTACYTPSKNAEAYTALYQNYLALSSLFEKGEGLSLMKVLRKGRR